MPARSPEELQRLLNIDRYPRSSAYEPSWQIENQMGPNVLWLTEFLCEAIDLRAGMRVLDLGCGKAVSSVFLAREFGVQVWATDLWIPASDNARRIHEAGLDDRVFPIHADARRLPYAEEFFDAVVSMDAFHYFGTDDMYLPHIVGPLRSGGQLGIVVPGVSQEIDSMPASWTWEFSTFHTPEWWRRHWEITRLVEVEVADRMPDGRDLWMLWDEVTGHEDDAHLVGPGGEDLGFTRIVARKPVSDHDA